MATGRVPTTANSPLTAKGDLFGYSTTQARVAVGNDGETLVADSSTSTGLRWQANFSAGKNKIINGDMGVWQRGTSINVVSGNDIHTADRFVQAWTGTGTTTVTRETFTPGTAPVAGYEGSYFLRTTMGSGATYVYVAQKIEDVRTFAGQTITISYWAKASSSFTTRGVYRQNFGTGGSGNVDASGPVDKTFTTSWVRYTDTVTMPSIAGKTIGTNSFVGIYFANYQSGTVASNVIDVWGLQVEAGNTATAFQTATGTIQGELSACQRYYTRLGNSSGNANQRFGVGPATSSTGVSGTFYLPVKLRVPVSSIDFSTLQTWDGSVTQAVTAAAINASSDLNPNINFTVASGLTTKQFYEIIANSSANAYIGFSAEL